MGKKRSYTVELESAPIGQNVTDELIDTFAAALYVDKRIAGPAASADGARNTLEVRTCVDATGLTSAIAIAEVAFQRAAKKAGVVVDIVIANGWLGAAADGEAGEDTVMTTAG